LGKEGSLLFLKKKKQKDFYPSGRVDPAGEQMGKSFLVLFFKKEHALFLALGRRAEARHSWYFGGGPRPAIVGILAAGRGPP